eukprot:scaffold5370_cov30-Prasinocladus_malaysianus.AAC.1
MPMTTAGRRFNAWAVIWDWISKVMMELEPSKSPSGTFSSTAASADLKKESPRKPVIVAKKICQERLTVQ